MLEDLSGEDNNSPEKSIHDDSQRNELETIFEGED